MPGGLADAGVVVDGTQEAPRESGLSLAEPSVQPNKRMIRNKRETAHRKRLSTSGFS